MRNVFRGIEGGRRKTVTSDLIIERDLKSGLFGMSLGVGYPASIVAQMLARRDIAAPGLLNPLTHVPDRPLPGRIGRARDHGVRNGRLGDLRRRIFGGDGRRDDRRSKSPGRAGKQVTQQGGIPQ